MRMYDIILKKREGHPLSREEIQYAVDGYVAGGIPDYQMAALLMAIYFCGMDDRETTELTQVMADSGDQVDLSRLPGIKVDKHSSGGVGDKTTLVVAPIVAACGVPVAKMSGRGLGHTGGTIDKLESIPGFRTALTRERFFELVETYGLSVVGQTGNLAPADKKLYALRDVTATVDSIPLIASSIMSKKLASGADAILLDVKAGNGAFMKDVDSAIQLAEKMVRIGERAGRRTSALITDMNQPLGLAVGNSLEVIEAIRTLKGEGPADLTELSVALAADMLHLAGRGELSECKEMAERALSDGSAVDRFTKMVRGQGGDQRVVKDPELFQASSCCREVLSPRGGYLSRMQTEEIGLVSMMLGAGRETKDSVIDPSAGILFQYKTGDYVREGECLVRLYTCKEEVLDVAAGRLLAALEFSDQPPVPQRLIYARVDRNGVQRYDG